jgi:hypothetical protein
MSARAGIRWCAKVAANTNPAAKIRRPFAGRIPVVRRTVRPFEACMSGFRFTCMG